MKSSAGMGEQGAVAVIHKHAASTLQRADGAAQYTARSNERAVNICS